MTPDHFVQIYNWHTDCFQLQESQRFPLPLEKGGVLVSSRGKPGSAAQGAGLGSPLRGRGFPRPCALHLLNKDKLACAFEGHRNLKSPSMTNGAVFANYQDEQTENRYPGPCWMPYSVRGVATFGEKP